MLPCATSVFWCFHSAHVTVSKSTTTVFVIPWLQIFRSQLRPPGWGGNLLHIATDRPNLPLWRSPLLSWGRLSLAQLLSKFDHTFFSPVMCLISNLTLKGGHWLCISQERAPGAVADYCWSEQTSSIYQRPWGWYGDFFILLYLFSLGHQMSGLGGVGGSNALVYSSPNPTVTGWKSWCETGVRSCPSEETHRGDPVLLHHKK